MLLIPIATLLLAVGAGGEPTAPRNDSIRQQDMKADLSFLAGDGFRGRLTGTAENSLACEFIASRFERLGLKRVGTLGSYFQRFALSTATLGQSNSLKATYPNGRFTLQSRAGQEFIPMYFCPNGERQVQGALTFVGFGISDPGRGHDDYRKETVAGRIVLVLDHEPGENDPKSPFDGVVMSEASSPFRKALVAQEKGAIGILFVSDVHNHPEAENFEAIARSAWPDNPPRIPRYTLQDWVDRIQIPAAQISTALARTLLRVVTDRSLEDLARAAEKPYEEPLVNVKSALTLATDLRRHVVPDRNVLAALEGSDPKLKDEWVVISCHHDHDGAEGDRVFNGADDNGSGTVGLLEIAEAYALAAQDGHRPKRSILFAAFNSEERGLLGSWAFVERPPVPLDRIVAVLNMDMVGRNEEVPEGGSPRFRGLPAQSAESNQNAVNLLGHSRSRALAATIDHANAAFGLTLKKVLDNNSSNLLRRSDQWPFLQKGVPAVFFHTGLHPDYHTPNDRPEKINYPKMERIVRLVHQASWDLAQQAGRPRLDARAPSP
ncbi:MAG: M28 family peptidase [Isosphaeraceae bacterium]